MIILVLLISAFIISILFFWQLIVLSPRRDYQKRGELLKEKEERIKELERELNSLREVYEGLKAQYTDLEDSLQKRYLDGESS